MIIRNGTDSTVQARSSVGKIRKSRNRAVPFDDVMISESLVSRTGTGLFVFSKQILQEIAEGFIRIWQQ